MRYVDYIRLDFQHEVHGKAFWSADFADPTFSDATKPTRGLVTLQDQHVSPAGAKAGKSETLGVLFGTASDDSVIVWRVLHGSGRRGGEARDAESHSRSSDRRRNRDMRDQRNSTCCAKKRLTHL